MRKNGDCFCVNPPNSLLTTPLHFTLFDSYMSPRPFFLQALSEVIFLRHCPLLSLDEQQPDCVYVDNME